MKELNEANWLEIAKKAAIKAGEKILQIYGENFSVSYKEDKSPLTIADQQANDIIESDLLKTNIPILSEEGKLTEYKERKNWKLLWIVDPLDGTKEFVKRNGEFTVNIALVKNGKPILGVIFVPVKGWLYYASSNGSYREIDEKKVKLPLENKSINFKVVGSRSHQSQETKEYFDDIRKRKKNVEIVSMGSSLKICLVAEGSADVYPRFAPTMEWDTAAGHAIAKHAGKKLIDLKTNQEMVYNRERLTNNWFIVE
ncbi:3'(2'),5'-bisphosphate nucleotidase CysQ [bacterium]|nr:3'(2'),5'-bisphosphate nucleotidase CysQ [bacterium]